MMHSRASQLSVAVVLGLLIAAGAAAVFAAPRASATHDDVPWSSFRRTTATGGFHEFYTDSLVDLDGYYYLFHLAQNTGTGAVNLRYTKYTMSGFSGGPTFVTSGQVNDIADAAYCCTYPSAAVDHNGNLYVAWARVTGGGTLDIHVSRSTNGGTSWDPSVRVNANTGTSDHYNPSLATTADGRLFVAWVQGWGTTNITVANSVNQGLTFQSQQNISYAGQTPTDFPDWPQLAADAQGRVYLMFYGSLSPPPFRFDVYETQSDDGVGWSAPRILGGGTSWQYNPTVTVSSDGTVHAAWTDTVTTPSGAASVVYRKSEDRGSSWSVPLPISQGAASPWSQAPRMETYGETVLVLWDATLGGNFVISYAISPDGGDVWYPEAVEQVEPLSLAPRIAVDGNGTFFVSLSEIVGGFPYDVGFIFWDGPPSAPGLTGVVRGTDDLTVSWTAAPEADVLAYRVWRSSDGAAYELVATVDAATLAYNDGGLAQGTYWYRVSAVDARGTGGHPSDPMSGTVGPTTDERFAAIQAEIDALQSALGLVQGDLDEAITLIDELAGLVGVVRSEQATSGQATMNLVLGIVIILLLGLILMMMRRGRSPMMGPMPPMAPQAPAYMPPSSPPVPPTPPMAPSEPASPDVDDL
ncbi:MAG TPA: BNR-4 repeat-containing protein [Thermoplasmata archaeon]|nr:BNR-4 repeat-containing protein [Thermoplasmata archaeon]